MRRGICARLRPDSTRLRPRAQLHQVSRSFQGVGQRKCPLPCRRAKTVILDFNCFKCALVFVLLLILLEHLLWLQAEVWQPYSRPGIAWLSHRTAYGICKTRARLYSKMRDDLQLQSSLTLNATHFGGSCDLSWPIRGQYSSQSEASILANQMPVFQPIRGQIPSNQ